MYLVNEEASDGFCKCNYLNVPSKKKKKGGEFVNEMSS
jgi:hypothetical protein